MFIKRYCHFVLYLLGNLENMCKNMENMYYFVMNIANDEENMGGPIVSFLGGLTMYIDVLY